MPKIFLSYAKENQEKAEKICEILENYPNLSVWMDKQELVGGADWETEIHRKITEVDYFVPLLSSAFANKNRYARRELELAIKISKSREVERFIVPVRIEHYEFELPELNRLHCIDLFDENRKSLHKLLSAIGRYGEYRGDSELRLTAHQAVFRADQRQFFYFINICNISASNIVITHVHYQDPTSHISISPLSRRLPVKLESADIWCTFIQKISLPIGFHEDAYDKFFVRLGNGHVYRSVKEDSILNEGSVPGGDIQLDDINMNNRQV